MTSAGPFKKRSLARTMTLQFLATRDLHDCYAWAIARDVGISLSATYANLSRFGDLGLATPVEEFTRFPVVGDRPQRVLWEITPVGRGVLAGWEPARRAVAGADVRVDPT